MKLLCPNFNFEDTPTGRAVEIIMAATAQLEREQNAEQVKNKMKARLEIGFWPFNPPPGLKNVKGFLTAHQPYAQIFKDAIEKYRSFELNTYEAVQKFIENEYSKQTINKKISLNGVFRILTNPLYCGHIEYEPWGITLNKGAHEGFITYETYQAVQQRILNGSKPRLRKDYNEDFPIRGYALCNECRLPMTAGWFKGNGGKVAYYLCKTKDCLRHNKTTPRKNIDDSFIKLLEQVSPDDDLLNYAEAILQDLWKSRSQNEKLYKISIQKKIDELGQKNKGLFKRIEKISSSASEVLINGYEKQIIGNENEIKELDKDSAKIKYSPSELQTATREVFSYIENPLFQWQSGKYLKQRLLLSMYFEKKISYHPELGFQTNELPLILAISKEKTTSKKQFGGDAGS